MKFDDFKTFPLLRYRGNCDNRKRPEELPDFRETNPRTSGEKSRQLSEVRPTPGNESNATTTGLKLFWVSNVLSISTTTQ